MVMLMKYRDRNTIVHSILTVCLEPQSKTKIMYKAYLSYEQLKEYLSFCTGKKLIELNGDGTYHITQHGKQVLELQDKLESVLSN